MSEIARTAGLAIPTGAEIEANRLWGGVQLVFTFPNGWGASVVRHRFSYGGDAGMFELGVLRHGELNYDNPLTSDVLGWLDPLEVDAHLSTIAAWEA